MPIPTFVSANAPLTPLILPSTTLLSCPTKALAPMAVALLRASAPRAEIPKKALLLPVVLLTPAPFPKNELLLPIVLF